MIEPHPLHWPLGYKKTKDRIRSKFEQTPDKVQQFLRKELDKLKVENLIVSTNIPVRKDGYIYGDMASENLREPGVAIYFTYKNKNVVMCCDTYLKVWENMYALAKAIESIRMMSRYGVSEFLERAFTGFRALPEQGIKKPWYEILGVSEYATKADITTAYRALSKIHHPDMGGTVRMFAEINEAYQEGLKQANQPA